MSDILYMTCLHNDYYNCAGCQPYPPQHYRHITLPPPIDTQNRPRPPMHTPRHPFPQPPSPILRTQRARCPFPWAAPHRILRFDLLVGFLSQDAGTTGVFVVEDLLPGGSGLEGGFSARGLRQGGCGRFYGSRSVGMGRLGGAECGIRICDLLELAIVEGFLSGQAGALVAG